MSEGTSFEFVSLDDVLNFLERALDIPQEMSIPVKAVTPMYLALEFLTENEENYAKFTDYLRVRVADTVDLIGIPSLEETRDIVYDMQRVDPTLLYLS